MTLKEYLELNRLSEIEDDEEFCIKEYDAISDYFDNYTVTDEDINEVTARGYQVEYFIDEEM
jgi:hypothetical protein